MTGKKSSGYFILLFTETHYKAFSHVRGATIDQTFLLPKRSYDLLLWELHALKTTSKDYSQQS